MHAHTTAHQVPTATVAHTAIVAGKELGLKAVYPDQQTYDPYDDWSLRDLMLGLMPLVITYAFKDIDLYLALAVGIALAGYLVLMRVTLWDSRSKWRWAPMLELISLILFAIMMGLIKHKDLDARDDPWWQRWWTVIAPACFAAAALVTLIIRLPFTAHYARYPKYSTSGANIWAHDMQWRHHADSTTLAWFSAFAVMCLLSLIPALTGHWSGYHGLNVVFNYVVPAALATMALFVTWTIGRNYARHHYAATAYSDARVAYGQEVGGLHPAGTAAYPATQTVGINHHV